MVNEDLTQALSDIANVLRINSIESTTQSNSGHPSSCASIAEIMSVLFFNEMKYHVSDPRNPANDRFVLSKGHAAPILYAAWAQAGLFATSNLLNLRKWNSTLDGHPTPSLEFIDVATGSLGQGLSCAAGMAYTAKQFDKADYRVYCIIGDGESAEGSIWEAMAFASYYKLDNLVNFIDCNKFGQSEETPYQHQTDVYKKRAEAFGWHAIVIDGHSVHELLHALDEAKRTKDKPTCIIAKTFKGKNIPEVEDKTNWHGKPIGAAKATEWCEAIRQMIRNQALSNGSKRAFEVLKIQEPTFKLEKNNFYSQDETLVEFEELKFKLSKEPSYTKDQEVATRLAYGNALVNLGAANKAIIALDGDVKNSTYSLKFKETFPDRFVECFIAEQNMVGVGIGCGTRQRTVPFISTFGAFFSRAFDQIRMAAISKSNIKLVGSHVGCSIGEDGPSQMALEDIATFRAVPNLVLFYPSDAVSTERAVELAANYSQMCYIRTSRPNTKVIYDNKEQFKIGKAKLVRACASDICTVVTGGVTLHEALKAADQLTQESNGTKCLRIIDLFTIKPLDWKLVAEQAKQTGNRIVIVEDHYLEGGIGEAVCSLLAANEPATQFQFKHLYVHRIPKSASPDELLEKFQINARAIKEAALSF